MAENTLPRPLIRALAFPLLQLAELDHRASASETLPVSSAAQICFGSRSEATQNPSEGQQNIAPPALPVLAAAGLCLASQCSADGDPGSDPACAHPHRHSEHLDGSASLICTLSVRERNECCCLAADRRNEAEK